MQSVSLILGKPIAGWLPVDIEAGDFNLSLEASDLGLKVIDQLIDVVNSLQLNQASECYFYLEPSAYLLKLRPDADIAILQIEYTEDFDIKEDQIYELLFQCEINPAEFATSLSKILHGFLSSDYPESDWPTPKKRALLK